MEILNCLCGGEAVIESMFCGDGSLIVKLTCSVCYHKIKCEVSPGEIQRDFGGNVNLGKSLELMCKKYTSQLQTLCKICGCSL